MARTKLSVTKALNRKKVNLNNSDVNENYINIKKVKITLVRKKIPDKRQKAYYFWLHSPLIALET